MSLSPADIIDRLSALPGISAVLSSTEAPVYLVGGSVRDFFLDRPLHDLDMVITGDLEQTARSAAEKLNVRAVPLGEPPLMIWRIPIGRIHLDLCPMEGETIDADLMRRDLTINAMAVGVDQGGPVLLDPTGGLADLEAGAARFVSEANVRADPIRMLRLFRFSAELTFTPTRESLDMVGRHWGLIFQSAGERIREELLKTLNVAAAYDSIRAMIDCGLLEAIIPELTALRGCDQGGFHHLDVLEHTLLAVREFERITPEAEDIFKPYGSQALAYLTEKDQSGQFKPALIKLALLLHDIGKPAAKKAGESGAYRFFGHEKIGAEMTAAITNRLRTSNAESNLLCFLTARHMRPLFLHKDEKAGRLTKKGVFRFGRMAGENVWGLLLHSLADGWASRGPNSRFPDGQIEFQEFMVRVLDELDRQSRIIEDVPRLINGGDLVKALSLAPSPLIGRLLGAVEEARAAGEVRDREEALALAADLLKEYQDD